MKHLAKHLELKEKWIAIIRSKFEHVPNRYHGSSSDLALATIHWHHNVEYDKRDGKDLSSFFCREYSRIATEIWLFETIQKLDENKRLNVTDFSENQKIDEILEMLCCALEAYEFNDGVENTK